MDALRTAAVWLAAVVLWTPLGALCLVACLGAPWARAPFGQIESLRPAASLARGAYYAGLYAIAPALGRALCEPAHPGSSACLWATTPGR